ncbi:MAG: penicillin acylase family protein [Caldilineaceae bacterium]
MADWCEPPVNVTYADTDGRIGYAMAGRVPLRSDANLGLIPAPGWSDDAAWTRLIPHAELPKLRDPASGVIVTANNKMVGDDYPISWAWSSCPAGALLASRRCWARERATPCATWKRSTGRAQQIRRGARAVDRAGRQRRPLGEDRAQRHAHLELSHGAGQHRGASLPLHGAGTAADGLR